MVSLFQEYAGHLAAWIPIALGVIGTASMAILLLRRRRRGNPERPSLKRLGSLAGWMLPLSVIGLIVTLGPMAPLFRSSARLEGRVGDVVPETRFWRVTDGSEQHITDLRGKVALVNLWATWCPPCRDELPTLDRLQAAYGDRGLVVVTLSDEERPIVASFVASRSPRVLNGYVRTFGWLDIRDFRPFSLIIDRDGILQDFVFGAQSYEVFERKLSPYLLEESRSQDPGTKGT